MDEEPRIGRLLVASPRLADPNFSHTVVLILARDGDEGALGVVLNRPSTRAVEEILASWAPLAADPAMVFVGGPVGHQGAIGLARGGSDLPGDGWVPIVGRLGTVDLARDPDDLPTNLDAVRVFSGHAGWGAGQLEAEIEAGAWVVLDAAPDDVLCADPDRLWRAVLRRQGGKLAWLANVPLDPRLN
ncbi:MAG: YqgE/AlgH family protein [Actinomycetota bacterium]|nr:YqgE/AlgH family protein [Actinomycetota bacterium]MDP8954804.1 YqgE/AlgH family protein [Actinomycetota bacterium]